MNKLTTAKRVAVVAALVEGNSINATARMTNVSKPTILKLLNDLGQACVKYQDEAIQNVRTRLRDARHPIHTASLLPEISSVKRVSPCGCGSCRLFPTWQYYFDQIAVISVDKRR